MKKRLKNYFIPHSGNDYKPHSLQKTAVVLMSVLVLLTFAFANLHALLWMNSSWLVSTVLPSVVVDITNQNRSNLSLGQLTRSDVLDRAAQLKAKHMAEYGYFSHYAPDGTSPWYWFDEVSYNYIHAGENLAVHFTDSDDVVKAWMESPSHRDNILNGNYTEIGVGTAKGEYQGFPTVFVVQLFATPARSVNTLALPEPAPTAAVAEEVSVPPVAPVVEDSVAAVDESVPDVSVVETPETPETIPSVLVSETVTTSRAVAGIEVVPPATLLDQPVTTMGRLATQPHSIINMVYAITSVFVLGALLLSIFIEIRKQHPVQIAYGVALLLLMAVLNYVHVTVAGGVLIG